MTSAKSNDRFLMLLGGVVVIVALAWALATVFDEGGGRATPGALGAGADPASPAIELPDALQRATDTASGAAADRRAPRQPERLDEAPAVQILYVDVVDEGGAPLAGIPVILRAGWQRGRESYPLSDAVSAGSTGVALLEISDVVMSELDWPLAITSFVVEVALADPGDARTELAAAPLPGDHVQLVVPAAQLAELRVSELPVRVVDASGTPLAGVRVNFVAFNRADPDGEGRAFASAHSEGEGGIATIPLDKIRERGRTMTLFGAKMSYWLEVDEHWALDGPLEIRLDALPIDEPPVLRARSVGALRVRVFGAAPGAPPTTLRWWPREDDGQYRSRNDLEPRTDGEFDVQGVPLGTWVMLHASSGRRGVRLEAKGPVTLDEVVELELTLPEPLRLRGRIEVDGEVVELGTTLMLALQRDGVATQGRFVELRATSPFDEVFERPEQPGLAVLEISAAGGSVSTDPPRTLHAFDIGAEEFARGEVDLGTLQLNMPVREPAAFAELSGVVLDTDGNAISHAEVTAYNVEAGRGRGASVGRLRTDVGGRFRFEEIPAELQTLEVMATADGYALASKFPVAPGTTNLELRLAAATSLHGVLLLPEGVRGESVDLSLEIETASGHWKRSTQSYGNKRVPFRFLGCPHGSGTLSFGIEGANWPDLVVIENIRLDASGGFDPRVASVDLRSTLALLQLRLSDSEGPLGRIELDLVGDDGRGHRYVRSSPLGQIELTVPADSGPFTLRVPGYLDTTVYLGEAEQQVVLTPG